MAQNTKALEKKLSGQLGEIIVEQLVLMGMNARWQKISEHNDDGVDGLIFFHGNDGHPSGQIAYIQVKRYKKQFTKSKPHKVTISFGKNEFKKKQQRWEKVVGASILVWVDANTNSAYWANLNDSSVHTTRGGVTIYEKSKFGTPKSEKSIRRLCGSIGRQNNLPMIKSSKEDFTHIKFNEPIIKSSKVRYWQIGIVADQKHKFGDIEFTKVGWRHLTRQSRKADRTMNSFHLLGVVEKIIQTADKAYLVRTIQCKDGGEGKIFSLSARISFPNRQASTVTVLLFQKTDSAEQLRTWFWSVYEKTRQLGIMGEQLP